MTISLLRPFGLWALTIVVAIALLHLLAPRWKHRLAPSLLLWKRVASSIAELRTRRPKVDLSALLGILGALALGLACSEPALIGIAHTPARELVVVIDNGTASLTEFPGTGSRLAQAKELARRELKALRSADRAALVATSPYPRVIENMGPPAQALEALGRVEPVHLSGSIEAAVSLALRLGLAEPGPDVVVLSSRARSASTPSIRWVQIGHKSRNLAIVDADFSDREVFLSLKNFSDAEIASRVHLWRLEPPQAQELASSDFRIPARSRLEMLLSPEKRDLLASASVVELSHSWQDDDLAVDNKVFAARMGTPAPKVGLIGEAPECLLRALWAARAETAALAGNVPPEAAGVNCLVYSREVPSTWPPRFNAILVSPNKSIGPIQLLEDELRSVKGIFAGTDGKSLVAGFPPSTVSIGRAQRVRILAPHEVLLATGAETLAAQLAGGHVYIGFELQDSDWPARASFPVFIARFLEEASAAAGGTGPGRLTYARVGQTPSALLGWAGGTVRSGDARELSQFARFLSVGLYRAPSHTIAVNLLSEEESDNTVGEIRDRREMPTKTHKVHRGDMTVLTGVLATVALALLAAEWLVSAHRT